jgi:hypothetical protein
MILACSDAVTPRTPVNCAEPAGGAIVAFAWDTRPDTMQVLIGDSATVAAACAYLATGTGAHIPAGPIVRGAGVDPRVPFHFIPDSVRLVEVAIELCDGRMMRTAAQVDEYFVGATGQANAQKAPFCPWGARPIAVR